MRAHGSIENDLHRTLAVALHEDDNPIRKGTGAENVALVRRLAEAVLRRDAVSTRSMPEKMQRAALDDDQARSRPSTRARRLQPAMAAALASGTP